MEIKIEWMLVSLGYLKLWSQHIELCTQWGTAQAEHILKLSTFFLIKMSEKLKNAIKISVSRVTWFTDQLIQNPVLNKISSTAKHTKMSCQCHFWVS